MADDKVEGAEKICGKCKTELICVKVISEYQGKTTEKLQWQNKKDSKPHFYFAGPGKFNCSPPKTPEQIVQESMPQEEPEPSPEIDTTIKVTSPFQEAELITRWADERAYKIVMAEVHDYSKLDDKKKNSLGQKQGNLTKILAETVIELMKINGIKSQYGN